MKAPHFPALPLAILLLFRASLQAEDWTTTDGKVYQDVKVVKTEPDAITILDRDGGALVPLAKLPPDLQKRFNYDPVKAQAAADARAKSDQESAKALQTEIDQTTKLQQAKLAEQKAAQKKAADSLNAPSSSGSATPDFVNPNNFVNGDVLGTPKK